MEFLEYETTIGTPCDSTQVEASPSFAISLTRSSILGHLSRNGIELAEDVPDPELVDQMRLAAGLHPLRKERDLSSPRLRASFLTSQAQSALRSMGVELSGSRDKILSGGAIVAGFTILRLSEI